MQDKPKKTTYPTRKKSNYTLPSTIATKFFPVIATPTYTIPI